MNATETMVPATPLPEVPPPAPPAATGWPNQTSNEGASVSLFVTGADPGTLSDVVAGKHTLPPGLSIDPNTGKISGTLAAHAGLGSPYTVTISATANGHAGSVRFTWNVNAAPAAATESPSLYRKAWSNRRLTSSARTIDDMITALDGAAATLRAMRDQGVRLEEDDGGVECDHACLITNSAAAAQRFGLVEGPVKDHKGIWRGNDDDPYLTECSLCGTDDVYSFDEHWCCRRCALEVLVPAVGRAIGSENPVTHCIECDIKNDVHGVLNKMLGPALKRQEEWRALEEQKRAEMECDEEEDDEMESDEEDPEEF